jgi:hypothetical protein
VTYPQISRAPAPCPHPDSLRSEIAPTRPSASLVGATTATSPSATSSSSARLPPSPAHARPLSCCPPPRRPDSSSAVGSSSSPTPPLHATALPNAAASLMPAAAARQLDGPLSPSPSAESQFWSLISVVVVQMLKCLYVQMLHKF